VRAHGLARVDVPWTPDIRGQIGSIHKSMTATCLVSLAEEGRVDLDAPVDRYLPWFRFGEPGGITLHHLLTHTAGLPIGTEPGPPSRVPMALLARLEPCWKPGERMWYSNTGYATLGLVIEAVTGQTAAQAVETRVLQPLGMTSARATITYPMRPTLPDGHVAADPTVDWRTGDPVAVAPYIVSESADGSVVATAEDMTRFVRLLLAGEAEGIVSAAAFASMVERTEPDEEGLPYGYGLGVEVAEGTRELSHSGGMVGHHAMMIADVGRGLGAIVLVNGPAGAGPIAEYAMALLRAHHDGRELPQPPAAPEAATEPTSGDERADLHAGLYRSHNPWSPAVRFARVGGRLVPRLLDIEHLDQVDEHRFRGRDALGPLPEYFTFDLELEGRMQRCEWNGMAFSRALDG
jgi:CubicO group peptidase (beta-lactamase class C family)